MVMSAPLQMCITAIYVNFDNANTGQSYKGKSTISKTSVEIKPITARFFGNKGTLLARTQFPLQLCFAATVHKLQGSALDQAVVYLGRKLFQSDMAYMWLFPE